MSRNLLLKSRKYALISGLFTLGSPIQSINAATLNAISISYFPVIQEAGVPQESWKLDTDKNRAAFGLDPSGAAIKDKYGEYSQYSLFEIKKRVSEIQSGAITALEQGSRYHGYKDPSADKSIEYRFLNNIEVLDAVPLSDRYYNGNPIPDYLNMMKQSICNYVNNQEVKEVWLYSYGGEGKAGWESNFSSKYGDISNSDRFSGDLPECNNSYTVYDYNYGRYIQEAVHNHLHQFEAIFGAIDYSLFWDKFTKSCGNTHFPPNGEKDYDYHNPKPVLSDCEDWHPNGVGEKTSISNATWDDDELKYYIYWMQNVPGLNNNLTNCSPQDPNCVPTKRLKNWWTFIRDFDNAYKDRTFFEDIPVTPPASVPEPSTLPFLGAGLAAMMALGRKRLFKKA